MLGHGFNSEVAQNKSMAASFENNVSIDSLKPQQVSLNQSSTTENPIGKKVNKNTMKIYLQLILL